MHRTAEIIVNRLMGVTFAETVFIPDVIGVEAPDDHLFVFTDGEQRIVAPQLVEIGTSDDSQQTGGQQQFSDHDEISRKSVRQKNRACKKHEIRHILRERLDCGLFIVPGFPSSQAFRHFAEEPWGIWPSRTSKGIFHQP
jgi:hypothetical protein